MASNKNKRPRKPELAVVYNPLLSDTGDGIPWTHFWDMHSGGSTKQGNYNHIYIQAPQAIAELVFYNRFGHDPNATGCPCCGGNYSISEDITLKRATGYHRGCDYSYFRPDGTECPDDEGFVSGKGVRAGYSHGYVDRRSKDYRGERYITLEEFLKHKDVLVIPASEITDKDIEGELPPAYD